MPESSEGSVSQPSRSASSRSRVSQGSTGALVGGGDVLPYIGQGGGNLSQPSGGLRAGGGSGSQLSGGLPAGQGSNGSQLNGGLPPGALGSAENFEIPSAKSESVQSNLSGSQVHMDDVEEGNSADQFMSDITPVTIGDAVLVGGAGAGLAAGLASVSEELSEEDMTARTADAELARMAALAKKRSGRSSQVCADSLQTDPNFEPPVYEKTWDQQEHLRETCAQSFLFGSLPPQDLNKLVDAFNGPMNVTAGTTVITEGYPVTAEEPGLFIIEEGKLNAYKSKPGFSTPGIKVHTYTKPGDTFGELALLYNCPRQATIIASTDCILWFIDGLTFNHCVKSGMILIRQRFDKLLSSMDIFKSLTSDDRDRIADVLHLRTYGKGEYIIREGDLGTEFFMLEEGRAVASVDGTVVNQYGPMTYFGELSLTKEQPRAVDVIAEVSPTVVAVLHAENFKRLLGSVSEIMNQRAQLYRNVSPPSQMMPTHASIPSTTAEGRDEDEDDEEEDEMDDEYFEQQAALMKNRSSGARQGIASEAWQPEPGWRPKVHQKTQEQHERIKLICADSWIFSSLTVDQLKQVVDAFEGPTIVNQGSEVIREGQNVSNNEPALFVFESGKLNVFKAQADVDYPGAHVFTIDEPGHSFGEVALLYNCPRTATIIAAERSVLWTIDRQTFNHCVKGAMIQRQEKKAKFLESVDILKDLTFAEREKIAEVISLRTFNAGDQIIKQGEEGNEFFMLQEGSATSSIRGSKSKDYVPGDYFGELAIIERQPRAADVFATATPTVLGVLDRDSFERLLGKLSDLMAERADNYASGDRADAAASKAIGNAPEIQQNTGTETASSGKNDVRVDAQSTSMRSPRPTSESWQPPVYPKSTAQFKAMEKTLMQTPVFRSVPPESFKQVIHAFKGPMRVHVGAGVIREGDRVGPTDPGLFLLEKGVLNVFKSHEYMKPPGELVCVLEKPWASFGEIALLHNCPRTATVVAAADSSIWTLNRETFHNCVLVARRKRQKELIKLMDSVDLFKSFRPDERIKIAEALHTNYYQKGDAIIKKGDDGTEFFLLEKGRAHAIMEGNRVVKEYVPNDFFGELSLLRRQPRIASVIALETPTVCATLDAESFTRLLGNFNDIMRERNREYEAASPHRLSEALDQDDQASDMDEAEFQRQAIIMAERATLGRRAVVSEKWVYDDSVTLHSYHKTATQYEMIRTTCLKSFLFQNLAADNLKQVLNAFKGPMSFAGGKTIFHQGARVNEVDPGLIILEKGSLEIYRAQDGQHRPGNLVAVLDRVGCAFGEVNLLHNVPRPATVVARTDCALWCIDRATFNNAVRGWCAAIREKRQQFLASVELFRAISTDERSKLIDVMRLRTYSRGQYIIRKGELGVEFFVLQEGSALAIVKGQRVREYGPNQYFGELALMYRQPRAADVIASASPTVAAILDAGSFQRILGNLQSLMAERAAVYSSAQMAGLESWIAPKRQLGEEWVCRAKNCNFRNLGRRDRCARCGQQRSPNEQLQAIVPYQALQPLVLARAQQSRPQLVGYIPVLIYGVELSGVEEGYADVLFVKYPRKVADVGIVQGCYPLLPGESFQVTVQSLGAFGELNVGLAPTAKVTSRFEVERLKKRHTTGLENEPRGPAAPAASRGSAMVGWNLRELSCTGDHGVWCFRGRLPGPKVTSPWEEGDTIECGIAEDGGVYMQRNGVRIDRNKDGTGPMGTDEYWPAEDSYPTVTFHSSGTEILLNLRNISRKPPPSAAYDLPPAEAARQLMNAMKQTVLPSANAHSGFWSWCSCSDVQVRRPETSLNTSYPASHRLAPEPHVAGGTLQPPAPSRGQN